MFGFSFYEYDVGAWAVYVKYEAGVCSVEGI